MQFGIARYTFGRMAMSTTVKKPGVMATFMHLMSSLKTLYNDNLRLIDLEDKKQALTRQEFTFVHQTKADREKLPLFLAMAVFVPELIPVVVVAFPNRLPNVCLTEQQKEAKRLRMCRDRVSACDYLVSKGLLRTEFSEMSRETLGELAEILGLSASGNSKKIEERLVKRLRLIREEDEFIRRDGIEALSAEEVREACELRGIPSHPMTEKQQREALGQWIRLTHRTADDGKVLSKLVMEIYKRSFP